MTAPVADSPKKRVCMTVSTFGSKFAATRAEIYLDRLAANVHTLRTHIGPDTELMAVVKADGYGHGAVAVGNAVIAAGASQLAVYTPFEAFYLRKSEVSAPIVILGPIEPKHAHKCVAYDLTPCISSLPLAEALSAEAASAGKEVPFHLEVDTGLTRYGVLPHEVVPLVEAIGRLPHLRREGLFTHFASADEKSTDSVWKQFKIFMKVRRHLEEEQLGFRINHVANSAATLQFPEMHLDLVRCGISLYGYYPSPHVPRTVELQPVMVLGSHLARVRTLPKGVGVSYGHDWRTEKRTAIGLVPFGYADGMPRTVQGKGHVLVRGRRTPIVGRVAMDQFMVDLSGVPDARQGDEVTIIGASGDDELTADEIARWAGTISYDVLSGISQRVPRLYISDGRPVAERLGMTTELTMIEAPA